MSKNILIRGPLLTQSGYGLHSRQVFKWAKSRNFNVKVQLLPWGITPWYTNGQYLNGLVGDIMESSGDFSGNYDYSFQIQLPNEWDPNIATKNIGVTALVETDKCNPSWVGNCASMDHVVVPSTFTAEVLKNSGHSGNNLSVITECFYEECLQDHSEKNVVKNVTTDFNFLLFGQITGSPEIDRKNTFNTIKWFCEEFQGKKDVGLIIKTNLGTNSIIDRKASVNVLKKWINNITTNRSKPKIYLLHGYLSPGEVAGLYQDEKVKCLISGTRGEGFGLPMVDAAASKLPVIATNWSGHLDFLSSGKWLPVDYELKRIPNQRIDGRIFIEGSKWAEPKEESFKHRLNKFYKNKGVPASWLTQSQENVIENHSFEKVCSLYDALLERV